MGGRWEVNTFIHSAYGCTATLTCIMNGMLLLVPPLVKWTRMLLMNASHQCWKFFSLANMQTIWYGGGIFFHIQNLNEKKLITIEKELWVRAYPCARTFYSLLHYLRMIKTMGCDIIWNANWTRIFFLKKALIRIFFNKKTYKSLLQIIKWLGAKVSRSVSIRWHTKITAKTNTQKVD